MTAYHIGIDLHKLVAQVFVLDAQGEVHRERRLRLETRELCDHLLDWLEGFGSQARLAVEALGCNRWFVLGCRARKLDVRVVDAAQLDLKRLGKKTDRRDAREIARRLYLGDLDRYARTYFPTEKEYAQRKLLRIKHALTQQRTSLLAQVRGPLNAYGTRSPHGTLYTGPGIAWLREQDFGDEDFNAGFQALVDVLEFTQRRIVQLMKRIRHSAGQEEVASWMMKNLPEVGPQTALTLLAEFGDASRFAHARAVACYGGVVPRVTASADAAHHGRMTHRGNRELRYILGQWAVRLLTRNERVKAWARPMLGRMNKNKVRVALARRLLIGVWVLLARGEVFSLERCLGQAA